MSLFFKAIIFLNLLPPFSTKFKRIQKHKGDERNQTLWQCGLKVGELRKGDREDRDLAWAPSLHPSAQFLCSSWLFLKDQCWLSPLSHLLINPAFRGRGSWVGLELDVSRLFGDHSCICALRSYPVFLGDMQWGRSSLLLPYAKHAPQPLEPFPRLKIPIFKVRNCVLPDILSHWTTKQNNHLLE